MDISAYNAGAAASCLIVGIFKAQTAFGMAATAVATTCGNAAVGVTRCKWRAGRAGWRAGRSCGLLTGLDTNALVEAMSSAATQNLFLDVILGSFCCAKAVTAASDVSGSAQADLFAPRCRLGSVIGG